MERCRGRRCCRRPPAAGGGGGGCRPRDVIWVPPPIPHPVKAARAPLPSPAAPSGCPPAAPESWLPAAAASMHPALYTRASMIREIAAAVAFISKFLRTKGLMNERQLQTFSQSLQELLAGEGGGKPSLPRGRETEPGPAGGGRGGWGQRGLLAPLGTAAPLLGGGGCKQSAPGAVRAPRAHIPQTKRSEQPALPAPAVPCPVGKTLLNGAFVE